MNSVQVFEGDGYEKILRTWYAVSYVHEDSVDREKRYIHGIHSNDDNWSSETNPKWFTKEVAERIMDRAERIIAGHGSLGEDYNLTDLKYEIHSSF